MYGLDFSSELKTWFVLYMKLCHGSMSPLDKSNIESAQESFMHSPSGAFKVPRNSIFVIPKAKWTIQWKVA